MNYKMIPVLAAVVFSFSFCGQSNAPVSVTAPASEPKAQAPAKSGAAEKPETSRPIADAATIMARPQVPILCYHKLREWKPNEKASMKVYIVPLANFKSQIKMLADSGYHTISPDEYYAYLAYGAPLPSKPVMITFDDTSEEHYAIANPELEKYGFKAVYFIMTVSLGRPNYMTKEQVKELSDKGNTIASHTYDHHNVKQYEGADYDNQMLKPKEKLEGIIGKKIDYFAYPFGEWKEAAIPELKKRNYKAAFQLIGKRDAAEPLYTIRRMIVPGAWDGVTLHKWMKTNFK